MSQSTKIIVADDQALLLQSLGDFLKSLGYLEVITCNDGKTAIEVILDEAPQIAILNAEMSITSGIEVAQRCRAQKSQTKFILMSLYQEKDFFRRTAHLGISGYIFKHFALIEIEECLARVIKGETYMSEELRKQLSSESREESKIDDLTPSETKILMLIALNKTTPQIAEELFISRKTVEKHRSNISKKLNLSGKTNSLLLWAKENIKNLDL